jgi:hypothetical protein
MKLASLNFALMTAASCPSTPVMRVHVKTTTRPLSAMAVPLPLKSPLASVAVRDLADLPTDSCFTNLDTTAQTIESTA